MVEEVVQKYLEVVIFTVLRLSPSYRFQLSHYLFFSHRRISLPVRFVYKLQGSNAYLVLPGWLLLSHSIAISLLYMTCSSSAFNTEQTAMRERPPTILRVHFSAQIRHFLLPLSRLPPVVESTGSSPSVLFIWKSPTSREREAPPFHAFSPFSPVRLAPFKPLFSLSELFSLEGLTDGNGRKWLRMFVPTSVCGLMCNPYSS